MQIIYQNKDEGGTSRRAGIMDPIICIRRNSRYMEGECDGGVGEKKQGFKLKKLERLMNVRNVDGSLNKEGPIEHTVEVNIYFKGHRERTEIDVIGGQKWTVILGMPWLACHNLEIDWRMGEVKMMRCPVLQTQNLRVG